MERITKDDISRYALKEGVDLSNNELDLIYAYIKKYSKKILDYPLDVLDEIKDDLSINVYDKILELYDKYKNKIS